MLAAARNETLQHTGNDRNRECPDGEHAAIEVSHDFMVPTRRIVVPVFKKLQIASGRERLPRAS